MIILIEDNFENGNEHDHNNELEQEPKHGQHYQGSPYQHGQYQQEQERVVLEPDQVYGGHQTVPNNTLGIISLVTGILGMVFYFCCFGIDLVLGVAALVTGILGNQQGQDYSLVGIVLGIIVIVLNLMALLGILGFSILSFL